ncbi:hypothetical protein LTR36_003507 [Oleoguttula mirabilis]|uniref:DUF1740-domain-containing protein n=1 Tax=Oleoguttula mirabilis TaxID=1507867 RepID=A0AAV9JJE7_9PEZI|nr:hypothetical protein LTR36_003507 [Oleoguttula mirabilis]
MATVPKFGSFKPKARRTGGEEAETKHSHEPAHDLERRSTLTHEPTNRNERRSKEAVREGSGRRHHSDDHHSKSREERGPRKKVIPANEVGETTLFIADRRGDCKNVEYGSLHRYSVPQYHRSGYGHLVGTPANIKINRDESTEKAAVLSRKTWQGGERSNRPLSGRSQPQHERRLRVIRPNQPTAGLEIQNDFIALRPKLKRKRGSNASEDGAAEAVDYRSVEGKAKPSQDDDDLEYASDSDDDKVADDLDLRMRQENAALIRRTKQQPSELEAWLALIEHQAAVIRPGADTSLLTAAEKRTLADVRLSIYDQALKHTRTGEPGHETLILGMIQQGSLIWERSKLATKWAEVLKASPGSIPLWTTYLDFVQTNHLSFKYEQCKTAYTDCLKILHNARLGASPGESDDVSTAQLYVVLRLTAFMRDAGYDELAYALWQLLLENNFFKPNDVSDRKVRLDALEDFWDSEVPRIGEEGAEGWSHYAQHGGRTTRSATSTDLQPLEAARLILSFAEQEIERFGGLHLPAVADDDLAMADPFRHVLFSDLQEVFQVLDVDLPKTALINAFLNFVHLPAVPSDCNETEVRTWEADQYLRTEAAGTSSSEQFGGISNERQTTFSLFHNAFETFHASGSPGKQVVNFADQVLERVGSAQPGNDRLAEYHIAYQLHLLPTEARKTAKRLLKAKPSSLRLYNAFALTEARLEGRAAKADEIWNIALKMGSGFSEEVRDDAVLLWHSWMSTKLHHENHQHALHLLLCMSDDHLDPKNHQRSSLAITASQTLKATQFFESGWEQMLWKRKHGHAALFAECHLMFAYLIHDLALEAGLATGEKYRARLGHCHTTGAMELLHQAQASLAKLHINHHRPYKPAMVREIAADSIRSFPNNSVFLELYAQVQAHFRIEDRVRASLQEQLLGGSGASIISWSFAVTEELRRCTTEVSGSTEHSVRSTFARALLQPDSTVKHSLALWTRWFRFEHPLRYVHLDPPRVLTEAQRKQALQRARQVFLDGLRDLPWSKAWVIMGLHAFVRDGGMSRKELKQVYDVLAERELRVRVELEETEDAIAEIGDA